MRALEREVQRANKFAVKQEERATESNTHKCYFRHAFNSGFSKMLADRRTLLRDRKKTDSTKYMRKIVFVSEFPE